MVDEEANKIAGEVMDEAKKEVAKKEYGQLIQKEAFEKIDEAREGFKNAMICDDNVDAMRQLAPVQISMIKKSEEIIDRMVKHELDKKGGYQNPKILKWAAERYIDIATAGSELRKIVEGKHDMQYGKKKVTVKVEGSKKDIGDLMRGN